MPNQPYVPREQNEPRGEKYDEPREDGLTFVVEDGGEKYWRNERGQRVCGAKRTNQFKPDEGQFLRCREYRLGVGNRCSVHGGKSKTGKENPAFKDGRHSQFLPKGLLDRYEKFLQDPELASMREELALLDTRISLILSSLDDDFGVGLWDDLGQ